MAKKTLRSRIQSLPPELYQQVYDLTFSTGAIESSALAGKYISNLYKPPLMLRMNRHLRENFSKQFYGNGSVFYFKTLYVAVGWLASLPKHHIEMIQHIRILDFVDHYNDLRTNRPPRLDLYTFAMTRLSNAVRLTKNPIRFVERAFEFNIAYDGQKIKT